MKIAMLTIDGSQLIRSYFHRKYAEDEFEKFRIIQDKIFESDFDRLFERIREK